MTGRPHPSYLSASITRYPLIKDHELENSLSLFLFSIYIIPSFSQKVKFSISLSPRGMGDNGEGKVVVKPSPKWGFFSFFSLYLYIYYSTILRIFQIGRGVKFWLVRELHRGVRTIRLITTYVECGRSINHRDELQPLYMYVFVYVNYVAKKFCQKNFQKEKIWFIGV